MNTVRNYLFVAALLSALSTIGCTRSTPQSDEVEPANTVERDAPHAGEAADKAHLAEAGNAAHAHHGGDGGLSSLTLNDGKMWAMDTHTRKAVAGLNDTVNDASIESKEDGQQLGETLNEQLKTLIQGCLMQGPAHDNLHIFLSAFMPAVNKLESAGSKEQAQQQLDQVKTMLQTYDRHFE